MGGYLQVTAGPEGGSTVGVLRDVKNKKTALGWSGVGDANLTIDTPSAPTTLHVDLCPADGKTFVEEITHPVAARLGESSKTKTSDSVVVTVAEV